MSSLGKTLDHLWIQGYTPASEGASLDSDPDWEDISWDWSDEPRPREDLLPNLSTSPSGSLIPISITT